MAAELNELQKKWINSFLEKAGGNGATDTVSPDTPGLDGLDSGKVQAFGIGDLGKIPGVGKIPGKVWNWVNAQGVTTIIIENYTSQVLHYAGKEMEGLQNKKDAKWVKKAPPTIAAAKDGNPGKATISVKTDKFWRGKTTANTSGWVGYYYYDEQEPNDGKGTVNIGWVRKGDGALDQKFTWAEGPYDVEGFQSDEGEFTFRFTDITPAPKPKAPQAPAVKKPEAPQTPTDIKLKEPLEFVIKPFSIGKHDKLDTGSIQEHAHKIWNDERLADIKEAILRKLPEGQLKIQVHGYTSNTDTGERNFELSKKRIEVVMKALRSVGVPETAFTEKQPHGEWETKPKTDDKKQEKEDDDWRKVVVKVSQ